MGYGTEGLSASDVALLSGNNGRNGDGMFGENGAWWVIIFLIFAFMGWGRNGFGNNGNCNGGNDGNGRGVMDAYVLNSDFATLSRQVDSGFDRIGNRIENANNGLCDGFYAVNTAFGNLNTSLCSQFGNTNNLIAQNGYESRLATQGLSSQLASCCCDIRQEIANASCATQRAIDAVNYNNLVNSNTTNANIAAGFTGVQNSMCLNTRDIIDATNNGTRAILDAITANRIEDKNAQIQAQQNQITALQLAASQEKQNNYLIDQLKPCPIPAYITCNPYQSYGFTYPTGGCGCGNNF